MKKHILSNERMMVKVADLYYHQNLSQQEIAAKLAISRPSISKLLQAARKQGIVSIHIQDPHGRTHFRLEQELEERFQLKEVVIVDSGSHEEETKNAMARAAAHYLSEHLEDGEIVGVGMGSTIAKIAEHIPEEKQRMVTFVPMIGGIGIVRNELHSLSLIHISGFSGNFIYFAHCLFPPYLSSGAFRFVHSYDNHFMNLWQGFYMNSS